jgi:predicted dehydrogenase
MTSPLRWGILSTARIGLDRVIPAMQEARSATILAIASRDLARAQAEAARLGIPRAYGSCEGLLADKEVEAIYNPLPNSLHRLWTLQAAATGKHVLCEKPLALHAKEAQELVDACQRAGVLLQEAFMYRFHPQIDAIQRIVHDGALGSVALVRSSFTFTVRRPGDIRLNPELGGGALLDVGCYCVNISRLLLGEPTHVWSIRQEENGVDTMTTGTLQFPGRRTAQLDCALRLPVRQFCEIVGTDGVLTLSRPFLPGKEPPPVVLRRGEQEERVPIAGANHYTQMVDAFAECVRSAIPPRFPATDAVKNMRVLDALRRSARTGSAIVLEAD